MTERDALLRAVLLNPDDDTPRLVLADCLEENGDRDRATFIRSQIELFRLRERRGPLVCEKDFVTSCDGYGKYKKRCRCSVCKLKQREYYSSRKYLNWDWVGGVSGGWAWMVHRDSWRRGFVESVTHDSATDWAEKADAILAEHPVREVTLTIGTTEESCGGFYYVDADKCYRSADWPGIRFTIVMCDNPFWEYMRARAERQRQVIQSLALPPELMR